MRALWGTSFPSLPEIPAGRIGINPRTNGMGKVSMIIGLS